MNITQANYLNLWDIMMFEVIGSLTLALIIGIIIIVWISIKNRVPSYAMLGLIGVWAGVIISYAVNSLVLFIMMLAVGIITYGSMKTFMKK